ncbi:unnamed protein product [Closterium sp. NIES-65]|nr:unnamed protein product [Closterium sp. NIES-65]CAI5973673.1 unnamed protein product [Closterium sp. NIES-65]
MRLLLSCARSWHALALVMRSLLSCARSCHALALVMRSLLSCARSCHALALVMRSLMSCARSCHALALVMRSLLSCARSWHALALIMRSLLACARSCHALALVMRSLLSCARSCHALALVMRLLLSAALGMRSLLSCARSCAVIIKSAPERVVGTPNGSAAFQQFPLDTVARATNDWATANLLEPSVVQVAQMATKHHPDLVRLLGLAVGGDVHTRVENVLLYEFVANGDLERWMGPGAARTTAVPLRAVASVLLLPLTGLLHACVPA